ncbi:MAG: glycerophosphodiester phosphodiesterase [Candidatus Fervidibacter sp.]|uniref:glycerophosphodiester phosphodiesterase n=1 Tax=Candidatus Fervidibacter sp. TaxID=3100871 RepID=UPI00404B801A
MKKVRTRPMVIAHRGFSGRFPENTLRSFAEALKLPVDAVELDVRRTKDGVLVVIHDETADRTTNGKGRVRDLTWHEIQKLDAGAWKGSEFSGERIPRLEEALQLVNGKVVVFLEIKEPDTTPQVIDTLRQLGAVSWVKIGSFHPQAVEMAKKLEPEVSCSLIGSAKVGASDETFADFVKEALRHNANSITVNHAGLTPDRIRYCHQRCIFVGTWTVNDAKLAEKMIAMGVDAIASDYPDVVLDVLSKSDS